MALAPQGVSALAVDVGDAFARVEVPRPSVVVAVVVLLAAAVLVIAAPRRAFPTGPRVPASPSSPSEVDDMTDFLVALGEAMVDAGDPVTHVRESLDRVARALGARDIEVVVLATALFVSVPGTTVTQTSVASAGSRGLRLDQVDDVFQLVDEAQEGFWNAVDGLRRLTEIRASTAPLGWQARVAGYAVLTLGISLILRGGWVDVALAAALGLLVGLVEVVVRRLAPRYGVFLPVVASFGVALAVFLSVRVVPDLTVATPLIAPLVIFLPGALLTTAVIELATGQMVSGAGRLSAGLMQLVLALGIVAAAQITGISVRTLSQTAPDPVPIWAPWVGVAVFALGLVAHNSAKPRSVGWILLVLYVAFAGQVVGGLLLGVCSRPSSVPSP